MFVRIHYEGLENDVSGLGTQKRLYRFLGLCLLLSRGDSAKFMRKTVEETVKYLTH